MTEREKMFAGKIYDPFSDGMPEQRTNAHRLCALYNETTEIDEERRNQILDELLPNRGEGVYLPRSLHRVLCGDDRHFYVAVSGQCSD